MWPSAIGDWSRTPSFNVLIDRSVRARPADIVRDVGVNEADVIVLGLGGIGGAAAYWLARRGARVIGLEQFELGHDRGESQDHSRIIRLSYHDAAYVRLAQAAYASWAEVSEEAGTRLVLETGGLDLYPSDAIIDREDYCSAMDAWNCCNAELTHRRGGRLAEAADDAEDVKVVFQERSCIAAGLRATPRTSASRAQPRCRPARARAGRGDRHCR